MTQRLEFAIAEAQKLSDSAQDALAALILEQIADDQAWDEAFLRSQDQLTRLAARAREDIAAGRVRPLSAQRPVRENRPQ